MPNTKSEFKKNLLSQEEMKEKNQEKKLFLQTECLTFCI